MLLIKLMVGEGEREKEGGKAREDDRGDDGNDEVGGSLHDAKTRLASTNNEQTKMKRRGARKQRSNIHNHLLRV